MDYFEQQADSSEEARRNIALSYGGLFWSFRYLEARHVDPEPQIGCTLIQVNPSARGERFVSYQGWYRRYGHFGKRMIAGIEGRIYPINGQLFWAGKLRLNGSPYLHVTRFEKDHDGVEAFASLMLHHSFTDAYMSARAYMMRIHPPA